MTYSNTITRRAAQGILEEMRRLPTADRLELMAQITDAFGRSAGTAPHAKEPTRSLGAFLPTRSAWTFADFRECLDARGVEYSAQQLRSAIAYFRKIGVLESAGGGVYNLVRAP